jgi:hypothetical protein
MHNTVTVLGIRTVAGRRGKRARDTARGRQPARLSTTSADVTPGPRGRVRCRPRSAGQARPGRGLTTATGPGPRCGQDAATGPGPRCGRSGTRYGAEWDVRLHPGRRQAVPTSQWSWAVCWAARRRDESQARFSTVVSVGRALVSGLSRQRVDRNQRRMLGSWRRRARCAQFRVRHSQPASRGRPAAAPV